LNTPLHFLAQVGLSLVPVFLFLTALIYLDSYKLIHIKSILVTIGIGCLTAGTSWYIYTAVGSHAMMGDAAYARYGAPILEEMLKASYLFYLIRARRVGFMVDATIQGFALGAGFALVENVYYLGSLHETNLLVWIIRGFGTAIMHGGSTAIVGVVSKNLVDTKNSTSILMFIPGIAAAIIIHSAFNHLIPASVLGPVTTTALTVIAVPSLMLAAFTRSERATRDWLGVGFDNDAELLTTIITGGISRTRIGQYLDSIQSKFPGEAVVDILCYLRLHLELAIQAKGILLMRESGFAVEPDPKVQAKFDEMTYLQKSIGKTGLLALSPFLRTSNRDLWQMHMLKG
jgi:RsiW-degrading membrane proteinase PrsW (M82 family)